MPHTYYENGVRKANRWIATMAFFMGKGPAKKLTADLAVRYCRKMARMRDLYRFAKTDFYHGIKARKRNP